MFFIRTNVLSLAASFNLFGFCGCNAVNLFMPKDHQMIRLQSINNKHTFNLIKT